ncbi:ArsS family sensor histidine kinase [Nitratifractor sp.]
MNIRRRITLLFLGSLALMVVIAVWSERSSLAKDQLIQRERYLREARRIFELLPRGDMATLMRDLNELGLRSLPLSRREGMRRIESHPHSFGEVQIYRDGERLYLYLRYLTQQLLLYDTAQEGGIRERYVTYALVGADLLLMILIFLLIRRMLSPLERLGDKMRRFAEGERQLRLAIDSDDEIGEVARSFNKMAQRLQETLESRERLLRDVGHELRTPITKGRFALESIPPSEAKKVLERSYLDLERLTDAILQRQHLENEASLQIRQFKAQTLITEALSLLYVDEECVEIELEDFEIEGDLHYLAIALKNLIDNALKYRSRRVPVRLHASEGRIEIANLSTPLREDLSHYLQAFTRESNERPGFGIGLNLVQKILQLHHFSLTYRHEDGYNIFTIHLQRQA